MICIAIFTIFENGHLAADQVFFISLIPQNHRVWPPARQRFHFQNITETLKINLFLHKLAFFLLPQRTIGPKNLNTFLFRIFVNLVKGKHFFGFSLHLYVAFKKNQRRLSSWRSLQKVSKRFFSLPF